MKEDMEAAVMSQQKNMRVLVRVSICDDVAMMRDLRKPDSVVADGLDPVYTPDVELLVTLITTQRLE